MWDVDSTIIVPIVVSVNGLIAKSLDQHLERLSLGGWIKGQMQKAVILDTMIAELDFTRNVDTKDSDTGCGTQGSALKTRDREDIIEVSQQPGGSQDNRRASSRRRRVSIGFEQERSLPIPGWSRAGFATRSTFQSALRCNSPSSASTTSLAKVQEQERSLPVPGCSRAGFATRSTFQSLLSCNSPSSASTSSLAKLRDKLTTLTPVNFTRVHFPKIAASPGLPILIEEEYERLSNSEPTRLRCGVARRKQYHSDSEAQKVKNKTRWIPTIVEEHSASLNVAAALDATASTGQSAIIEAFEELHNKNPEIDIVTLLVEEALNHGQDKDSGIISGKVTQDSDIVENTPLAETAQRKKLGLKRKPKDIEEIRYATDDSDAVDVTPGYDYDWRKRGRTKSNNKNNNDENETLNENAVDTDFYTNCVELISPATIKRISESLSLEEDIDDDCYIIDGREIEEEDNELNLAVETDIVNCVNDMLDKVCYDLETCVDLLVDQQQQIDTLRAVQNIDNTKNTDKILKMNKDTLKSPKNITNELDTDGVQNVTLKYKPKKQAPKKNTSRGKKANSVKLPNIEEDGDSKENAKSPTNTIKQSIRKKRKLYSPKDDDNENNDMPRSRKEPRPSSSTESPIAACYKELENARKSRIRLPRRRASTQPVISPKTKEMNDIFDKIKDNVVNNEKITLVNKKSDKDLYNMSSESDDEVFQKKKIQVQERISSSSLESVTKRRRSVKPVDYTSFYSSEDECQRVVKPKAVKQTRTRSRKAKIIQRTDLIDERMRTDQPEVLETSFVQEKDEMNVPEEPQPSVNVPVLETIPTGDIHDEPIVSRSKPQTPNKQEIIKIKTKKCLKKKCENLEKITKRSKEIIADDSHDESIVSGRKPQTPNKPETIKMKTDKSFKKRCENLAKITKRSKEIIADDSHDESIVSGRKPQTPNKPEINRLTTDKSFKKRCEYLAKINEMSKETIADDSHDESIVSERKPQTPNKPEIIKIKTDKSFKKRCVKLTKPTITKRSKTIIKNVPTERESTTVSPLPGLVVETEPRKDEITSSLDANLLQKLKKIYTDVDDLNTSCATQNLLLNEDNDRIEVDLLNKTCHNQNVTIDLDNSNDNAVAADNLQAVDIPDVDSEKSIETGGRSPITGHNDLDEPPPNLDALDESFQHRDVDVEGKRKSITDFLVKMRNQIINSKTVKRTSPIIPITRMSTKDSARSNICAKKISNLNRKSSVTSSYIGSDKSNPRVVLERISSEDIDSQVNPVTPKSKVSDSRVVLTRMSSEEIEKIVTPTRTQKSSTSTTESSPVVLLNRISSDEINKWLPLPETKDVVEIEPEIIPRKTLERRKSVSIPCFTCENFEKTISPVKLNFEILDLTNETEIRDTRIRRTVRSRRQSSVRTIKSCSNIEKSISNSVETLAKELHDQGVSSQETVAKSAETPQTSNISNKKTLRSTVAPSEISESVASVQSWIRKNVNAGSSKTGDKATMKEMLYQEVMETLNTRVVEINAATGEAMQAAFVKDQEELTCVVEQVRSLGDTVTRAVEQLRSLGDAVDSLEKRITAVRKNEMDRACSVIRADAEKKARLVALLKEDIERILK
ncbi:uncharacterized protein LOC134800635 [Cydia splendana]|uniref:uncharacterized protein LOC134800635 n=1 Tax=Cydia splendana TaxID=1100963 RepID=UPI00300D670D